MTWREKCVVRILLLVAKMVDEGPWRDDIQNLANHISTWAPKDKE